MYEWQLSEREDAWLDAWERWIEDTAAEQAAEPQEGGTNGSEG